MPEPTANTTAVITIWSPGNAAKRRLYISRNGTPENVKGALKRAFDRTEVTTVVEVVHHIKADVEMASENLDEPGSLADKPSVIWWYTLHLQDDRRHILHTTPMRVTT